MVFSACFSHESFPYIILIPITKLQFNTSPSLPLKILIRQDNPIISRSSCQSASPVNSAMVNKSEKDGKKEIQKNTLFTGLKEPSL